jgi:hypothetical protein
VIAVIRKLPEMPKLPKIAKIEKAKPLQHGGKEESEERRKRRKKEKRNQRRSGFADLMIQRGITSLSLSVSPCLCSEILFFRSRAMPAITRDHGDVSSSACFWREWADQRASNGPQTRRFCAFGWE